MAVQVAKTVRTQRVGGGSLAVLGLVYMSFPFTWLRAVISAKDMARRLATRMDDPASAPAPRKRRARVRRRGAISAASSSVAELERRVDGEGTS